MPVKKEREYRTLVAPLAAQSSGEKRLQSECYVEGYHASVAWGWDKKSPLNTGEKSYDVGNIYQYYAYSLAALIAGGYWADGALCGARAVYCGRYPWGVNTSIGARGACDSL